MAEANPVIAAARNVGGNDPNWVWGFDYGTAVSKGFSLPGPGQDAIRNKLADDNSGPVEGAAAPGPKAFDGFEVARAVQYGITKMGPPAVVAGQLAVQGVTSNLVSSNTKAGVVSSMMQNPGTAAGATAAVQANTGFFHRILAFFGLA
jgi:hypothetical protein